MNKVELEAKVDALMDELNFLRALYDAVWVLLIGFSLGNELWPSGSGLLCRGLLVLPVLV